MNLEVENFERLRFAQKSLVDGWKDEWMGGWMVGRKQKRVKGLLTAMKISAPLNAYQI